MASQDDQGGADGDGHGAAPATSPGPEPDEAGPRPVRPKMSDLARLAGVSVSTVSRALSDSPLLPLETRQAILRLAEDHGYVANIGARRLRLQQTEVVAVVIPLGHAQGQPVSDPFFLELVGHLADEVSARGYDVLLTRAPSPEPGWLSRLLRSGRADGVVVVGQSDQHEALNEAASRYGPGPAPLVVWGSQMPEQAYCTVGVDNFAGARAATRHLIERGARRPAFLGASALPEFARRLDGFKAALAEAGLPFDPDHVASRRDLDAQPGPTFRAVLDRSRGVDAVMGCTDVIAAAVLKTLVEDGRSAPEDMLVAGFDDIALAAASSPPLTTVRQDLSLGARLIVDMLFRRLAGEDTASVEMPAPLVVRRSTLR